MSTVPRLHMDWYTFVFALRDIATAFPWYIDCDGGSRARARDGEEGSPIEAVAQSKTGDRFHLGEWLGAAAAVGMLDELASRIVEAADQFAGYDGEIRHELIHSLHLKERYDRLPNRTLSPIAYVRLKAGIPGGEAKVFNPGPTPVFHPQPPLTRYGEMIVYHRVDRAWRRLECRCGSKFFTAASDEADSNGSAILACLAGHENRIPLGFRAKPANH